MGVSGEGGMNLRKAVFLDRDGVLNRAEVRNGLPYPPAGPESFELLPEVTEACAKLRDAGYLLVVVTNQPDVARGTQTREQVEKMHGLLKDAVPVHDIRVCYHDSGDRCECRKPHPGMLLDAAREWGIDLAGSVMVGDRWRDVEAGQRAGCRTVFLDYGYAEKQPTGSDFRTQSLREAAAWILASPSGADSARVPA
jgi:D-glycero-D-manno-heptose 1,7-bisphosphate phosphatase